MDSIIRSTAAIICSMAISMVILQSAYANDEIAKVDINKLPSPHLTLGNKMGQNTVSVIIDPRCEHCKALYEDMRDDKDTKYNVYLNPSLENAGNIDEYIQAIYCSDDRKSTLDAAFNGRQVDAAYNCDIAGMNELRAFVEENKLLGTPIAILSNGEVKVGYKIKSYWM